MCWRVVDDIKVKGVSGYGLKVMLNKARVGRIGKVNVCFEDTAREEQKYRPN